MPYRPFRFHLAASAAAYTQHPPSTRQGTVLIWPTPISAAHFSLTQVLPNIATSKLNLFGKLVVEFNQDSTSQR